MPSKIPTQMTYLMRQVVLCAGIMGAAASVGCSVSSQELSAGDQAQTAASKSCGELAAEAGYKHDVLKCYRALDASVPGCGWPPIDTDGDGHADAADSNQWMCDVLQRPADQLAVQRPISSHRWTIADTDGWLGHEWAILNYNDQTLTPTMANGEQECSLCLGYAQGGYHPLPPALLNGLWQTSLGPIWNIYTAPGEVQIHDCGTWEGSYSEGIYAVYNLVSAKAHCRALPSQAMPIDYQYNTIGFTPLGHDYRVYVQGDQLVGSLQVSAQRTAPSVEPLVLQNEWILIVTAIEESLEGLYPQELLHRIQRGQRINAFRYDFRAIGPDGQVPQTGCHDLNPEHCSANANAQATFALRQDDSGWPVVDMDLAKPLHIGGKFSSGEVYVLNFFGFKNRPAEIADNGAMVFCDHALIDSAAGLFADPVTFGLGFCLTPAFSTPIQF